MKTKKSEWSQPIRKLELVNQKIAVAAATSKQQQKKAADNSVEGLGRADLETFSLEPVQTQYELDGLLLTREDGAKYAKRH